MKCRWNCWWGECMFTLVDIIPIKCVTLSWMVLDLLRVARSALIQSIRDHSFTLLSSAWWHGFDKPGDKSLTMEYPACDHLPWKWCLYGWFNGDPQNINSEGLVDNNCHWMSTAASWNPSSITNVECDSWNVWHFLWVSSQYVLKFSTPGDLFVHYSKFHITRFARKH